SLSATHDVSSVDFPEPAGAQTSANRTSWLNCSKSRERRMSDDGSSGGRVFVAASPRSHTPTLRTVRRPPFTRVR
ncbi:MAG: hypothetical protein QOG99_3184, partial [Frankiales bacterium]|nr:hypothetical protein [Frankiales bacterium]